MCEIRQKRRPPQSEGEEVPIEQWKPIEGSEQYLISDLGRVYNTRTESFMAESRTMQGSRKVTLSVEGERFTRSVRVLVAEAYVPKPDNGKRFHKSVIPDTVIVLDGDQENLSSYNLAWRSRWFAISYARQFKAKQPDDYHTRPVQNETTKALYGSIVEAGTKEGLLFDDIWKSATTGIAIYPTEQAYFFP